MDAGCLKIGKVKGPLNKTMEKQMDEWKETRIGGFKDDWIHSIDVQMNDRIKMGGWKDGGIDGWTYGWVGCDLRVPGWCLGL